MSVDTQNREAGDAAAANQNDPRCLFVGLDVHQTHTTMHVLNADGK